MVVAHEHARAHGKGGGRRAAARARDAAAGAIKPLALALFCAVFSPSALALPEGGAITAGSGGIAVSGDTMSITQESARLAADFQRFGIAAQETVRVYQPASAVALFRVLGNDRSAIFGRLIADGQVFLSNPNGILFGKGAQVDVGGLVATTLKLDPADFMAGRYRFQGGATGSVANEGAITAREGGYVALLAPEVRNDGVIVARLGSVALGAAQAATLDFSGTGRIRLQIDQAALDGSVANRKTIIAEGGQVILSAGARDALLNTVVNNEGVIEARRVSQTGGVIRLEGGSVTQKGTLDADGATAGDRGGEIVLVGDHISLAAGSTSSASGSAGGGTILIGGDLHGGNPDIANAQSSSVVATATLRADALDRGDGGKVVVWSEQETDFQGGISARGGAQGGDGGFAEVSGKTWLNYDGLTDLTAPQGKVGSLLLDPKNITISATGSKPVAGNSLFTDKPAASSNIKGATLAAAINTASVTLQANNDITFNDDVVATTAGNGLTLQAGRSISFAANKKLSLNGGDFTASINDNAAQAANRGAGIARFTMAAGASISTGGGEITVGGGNLDGSGAREVRLTGSTLDAGSGNIGITGSGRTAAASGLHGVSISGGVVKTSTGNISITGSGGAGTSGNHGVYLAASAAADTLITTTSGAIAINGSGGNGSNNNHGVSLAGNGAVFKAKLQSTSGSIDVTGTSQGKGSGNIGIAVAGGGEITTGGALALSGTGSSAAGATSGNHGIYLSASATAGSLVQALGSGGVTLTGTGGKGSSSNYGVALAGNGAAMKATLQSAAGDLGVTGSGGAGSGANNYGVALLGGGRIATSAGGAITVIAASGNGANGFYSNGAGSNGVAGTGAVALTASGGNASRQDFRLAAGDSITGTAVTINADRMNLGGSIAGPQVTLRPGTAGWAVNLGSATDALAGTLELSAAEINRITAATLVLGSAASGSLGITAALAPVAVSALHLQSGGTVSQNAAANLAVATLSASGSGILLGNAGNAIGNLGALSASAGAILVRDGDPGLNVVGNIAASGGDVTLRTTGDLLLGAGSSISASGANNITLDNGGAGGRFLNASGAAALSVGTGRWLVYSSNPAGDTFGGLDSGNTAIWNTTHAATPPAGVTQPGNRYLFAHQPTATFTSTDLAKTYGDDAGAALANAYSVGLHPGVAAAFKADTAASAYTGAPGLASAGAASAAAVAGSPYPINISQGSLGALNGYALAYVSGGGLTVNRAPLTVTANAAGKAYDGLPWSGGNGVAYSGFVNGETSAVLGGALAYGGNSQGAVNAGDYAITPSGLSAANYQLAFVDGNLRISAPDTGAAAVGILEIVGIQGGSPVGATGTGAVAALNALPGTAAGGDEAGPNEAVEAPFQAGEVSVLACGIALPAGIEPDSGCRFK